MNRVQPENLKWLLINLCNSPIEPPTKVVLKYVNLPKMKHWENEHYREIDMFVPNMAAPSVPKEFWVDLWESLCDLADKERGLDVLVYCQGGHGRTGTVLAALLGLFAKELLKEGEDPILWIQGHYCEEAVESQAQVKYLEKLLGYESKVKINYAATGAANYGGYLGQGRVLKAGAAEKSGVAYTYQDIYGGGSD